MSELKDYTENTGLLVQKDGDGGDSSYMTALASGLLLLDRKAPAADYYFKSLVDRCNVKKGIWVRHPNKTKWYSNPNNLARDSMQTIMWCMAIFAIRFNSLYAREILKDAWIKKMLRFGFHQNIHIGCDVPHGTSGYKIPDITSPEEISQMIRGMRFWFLYPLLLVLDFSLLFNVLFCRSKWDADSLLAKNIIIANIKYVTPVGYLSKLIYRKTDYKSKIKNYYYKTGNSIEPLGDLYIQVCNKFIGG